MLPTFYWNTIRGAVSRIRYQLGNLAGHISLEFLCMLPVAPVSSGKYHMNHSISKLFIWQSFLAGMNFLITRVTWLIKPYILNISVYVCNTVKHLRICHMYHGYSGGKAPIRADAPTWPYSVTKNGISQWRRMQGQHLAVCKSSHSITADWQQNSQLVVASETKTI